MCCVLSVNCFLSGSYRNHPSDVRTFRLKLDSAQYYQDMDRNDKGGEDIYSTLNLVMRRKPKENNFKAILETIHSLMNSSCVVPDWLHDVFLGTLYTNHIIFAYPLTLTYRFY